MKEKVLEKLRRPWLWGAAAAVLVLTALLAAAIYHFGADDGRIRPGTAVEGTDVGGLPPEEALRRLEARDTALSGLVLTWGPKAAALGLFALSFLRLVSSSYNPFIYFRF